MPLTMVIFRSPDEEGGGAPPDETPSEAAATRPHSMSEALRQACYAVASGAYDVAMAVGVEKVKDGSGGFGYNAATGEYLDLVKAGIIDPALVAKTALVNAASVAGLMLTTNC
ncbi:MAG: hypothetical protein HC915_21665, partial [Anaerolineae bacterium]|nr:hypothetical protein [Anaerolineae bacterium]